MPANLSQMIITSLLFIGGMRRARGDACTYFGAGSSICRLDVLHDVWLEKEQSNNNGQDYLIVGKEKGFSLKRSLLRFEMLDATHDCTTITDAYMYVYFVKSHKPSSQDEDDTPYLSHDLQLHIVNKEWVEDEATSLIIQIGAYWESVLLAVDGSDAEASVLASQPVPTGSPTGRWIQFKVTDAVKAWDAGKKDNNGLLMKVAEEDADGRSLRFYSNDYSDTTKHAYINVICS